MGERTHGVGAPAERKVGCVRASDRLSAHEALRPCATEMKGALFMKPRIPVTIAKLLVALVACVALTVGVASAATFYEFWNDGDIPGVPIPASPFSSSITETTTVGLEDFDDVFAIPVGRNELLEVTMTLDDPEANDDFDLILFPPGTKAPISAAYSNKKMVAASENDSPGATETLRYVPDRWQVGDHYVQVYCFYADGDDENGGKGNYTITWSKKYVSEPLVTSGASRSTVNYGSTSTISGVATVEGAPIASFPFTVMGRAVGTSTWKRITSGTTAADGTFKASVKPLSTTEYFVRTQWSTTAAGEDIGYGYGPAIKVAPRAYLAFKTVPRVAYRNRAFTVSGTIKPSHSTAKKHVKIVAERWNGKRWVRVKSTYVRSSGTKFSGRVALPSRGTWRLQAQVGADKLHAAKSSARKKLTVR